MSPHFFFFPYVSLSFVTLSLMVFCVNVLSPNLVLLVYIGATCIQTGETFHVMCCFIVNGVLKVINVLILHFDCNVSFHFPLLPDTSVHQWIMCFVHLRSRDITDGILVASIYCLWYDTLSSFVSRVCTRDWLVDNMYVALLKWSVLLLIDVLSFTLLTCF